MDLKANKVDSTPSSVSPNTIIASEWNQFVTEANNVIKGAGLTPSSTNLHQLYTAIGSISTNMDEVMGVSFDGTENVGTRLYKAASLQAQAIADGKSGAFSPSTDVTEGVDYFKNTPIFNGYYALVKKNTSTGKAEIIATEGTTAYNSIKSAGTEDYDEVRMFPCFWYKRTINADGSMEELLSPHPKVGYKPSPMHFRYDPTSQSYVIHDWIGITRFAFGYDSSATGGMAARTGLYPLTNTTEATFYTKAVSRGLSVFGAKEFSSLHMLGDVKYGNHNWQQAAGEGYVSTYSDGANVTESTTSQNYCIVPVAQQYNFAVGRYIGFGENRPYNSVHKVTAIDTSYDTTNNWMKVEFDGSAVSTTAGTTKAWVCLCPNGWSENVKGLDGSNTQNGAYTTSSGKCAATYLGIENLFGNVWKMCSGIMRMGGYCYINPDPDHQNDWPTLSDDKGWTKGPEVMTTEGYIKRFYPTSGLGDLDYLSIPVELGGNATKPVGDYQYTNTSTDPRMVLFGGSLGSGDRNGPFCLDWRDAVSDSGWSIGALGVFIP